ncbi:MAG: glycerate kinase family protein [Solirubrobacteraceae bacterium]
MTLSGIPSTVLIAPDAFKGTLRASEVAAAIGDGLRAAGRSAEACPVADGGEGTLAALADPLGAERRTVRVSDPLGRPVQAEFGLAAAPRGAGHGGRGGGPAHGPVAIVEMAAASGLELLPAGTRDPIAASTHGTGELILAALEAGASLIYLGVGGSATTDGGAGAIRAIRSAGGLGAARIVVLCDVRTPFEAAARVFGPQKGASPDDVRRLSARLRRQASALPRDPRGVPMTGAAGGLAGGLWAAFGAVLRIGAPFILDVIGFDARMRAARAVVTGEGCLDSQSLAGKAVSEVATRARQAGVPCFAVVGRSELDPFGARILDLQGILEAGTVLQLQQAGRKLAALI